MQKYLAAIFLLLITTVASARIGRDTMLDLAEQSDLVFTGTVGKVEAPNAMIQVEKVLQGKIDGKTIVVTPITLSTDVGPAKNFTEGESVLIFAKSADGKAATVSGGGQGKIVLDAKTRDEVTAAAARLIEIAAIKDEDARNLAMIDASGGTNARLHQESWRYIALRLENNERYKKQLIMLLDSADPIVQRAGLEGLRFVEAPEALPRIIELSHSKDAGVVDSASLAMARYVNHDGAAAAMIALTQSPSPEARKRAAIDLSNNRQPDAKAAIVALPDDKDASVRAIARTGLVYLLRDGKADDQIPKLAVLLKEPDDEVSAAAARALGETRNLDAIPPLLEVLRRNPVGRDPLYFALGSLYSHYSKDDAAARPLIDKQIDLIVAALKNDKGTAGFSPAFQAMGILQMSGRPEAVEAVKWAAESHPNKEIRDIAAPRVPK